MPKGKAHPVIDAAIGRRLRIARSARAFTQRELAHLVDIKHQQIQKYEAGTSRIAMSTLVALSRVLRVSLDYFIKDLPEELRPPPSRSQQDTAKH